MQIRNGNKQLSRDINKSKILNLIRSDGPISRVSIAKKLSLSQATVTYITEELIGDNFIFEEGEQKSTGGRKARLLSFNINLGVIASVGISNDGIEVALCTLENQIITHDFVENDIDTGELAAKSIVSAIRDLLDSRNNPELLGISIISSGLIDRGTGTIVKSTLLNWTEVPIKDLLQPYFPKTQIIVDRDINAVAMYEMSFGSAKSLQDFLVVSVGEGLGLSVVIGNRIYYGDYGGAGEFGHTVINVGGYLCHCGQRGCLEQYASEFYLKNKLTENSEFKYGKKHILRCVGQAADRGDSEAIELLNQMGTNLGYGLRNLINVFNPKAIILVGSAMEYSQHFANKMLQTAKNNFFANADLPTNILSSKVPNDAWYQGASILMSNSLFETPIYQEVTGFGRIDKEAN